MAEQPGNIPNPTTPPAAKPSQGSATLCPYCGNVQISGDRCQNCKGLFEPLSRPATQICLGPWFIRDTRNPFKPGCSYDVIAKMVKGGKIKANSVMRGPTTMQFWQVARNVPGIAHLLGSCHECNTQVSPQDAACPKCGTAFDSLATRNELGLLYRTDEEARVAQDALDKQISGEGIPAAAGGGQSQQAAPQQQQSQSVTRSIDVNFMGSGVMSMDAVRELIEQFNEALGDGAQLNVVGG